MMTDMHSSHHVPQRKRSTGTPTLGHNSNDDDVGGGGLGLAGAKPPRAHLTDMVGKHRASYYLTSLVHSPALEPHGNRARCCPFDTCLCLVRGANTRARVGLHGDGD
jgi:hypothetical protein